VSNGTVIKDLADIVASQLSEKYADLEQARITASLLNAAQISQDALSQIAISNFKVLRDQATKATGTVTFQAKNAPSVDISIPLGTIILTKPLSTGSIIQYVTTEAAVLATTAELNLRTGFYEVDVEVEASVAGTRNHVGLNSLTSLPNRISGINAVTNKAAINNATDEETNESLATKITNKTAGSLLGTGPGYEQLIIEEFEDDIDDVAVVGPFDSDNLREQFGNEVDVPVISSADAASFTAILTANGTDTTLFGNERPIVTVSSVIGATLSATYVENVDWGFDRDTGPVFGYSNKSFDALCWFPGKTPNAGLRLSVQGTHRPIVRQIQSFLNNTERKYITGDLLVKEGVQVPIDMTLVASALSGVDRTQLQTDIETAISGFLLASELGDDILADDIIKLIQDLPGVDAVEVPITLKKSSETESSESITIRAQEYPVSGTISVTVN